MGWLPLFTATSFHPCLQRPCQTEIGNIPTISQPPCQSLIGNIPSRPQHPYLCISAFNAPTNLQAYPQCSSTQHFRLAFTTGYFSRLNILTEPHHRCRRRPCAQTTCLSKEVQSLVHLSCTSTQASYTSLILYNTILQYNASWGTGTPPSTSQQANFEAPMGMSPTTH